MRDEARAQQNVGTWRRGSALRQPAPVHGAHQQIFKHREALERLRDLIGASDPEFAAMMRAGGRYVAIVETDFTAIGSKAPGDQIEQRRLASTVGADDAKRLAGRDREIEIVRRDHRAERFAQAFDLEKHESCLDGRQTRKTRPRLSRISTSFLARCTLKT